ncbi:hypothetical protein BJP25_13460 [Actinokineospora bangkokensis]|uniref:DUF397 domain-containing protein n=1 Tax=Actinokineospora bangkokensis TaxID=1193682 RepID=A0A1Q9LPR2_9PSEU|nr:hypothetical protein BJP25_13460 [Actinokineospora bangkokensis]
MGGVPEGGWRRARGCGRQLDCVEVNPRVGAGVGIRDSKAPSAGVLLLPSAALVRLVGFLREPA